MAKRKRGEIVVVVITREHVVRFVVYDVFFSWLFYQGLTKLHAPSLIPFAGSVAGPMLLRRYLERQERDTQASGYPKPHVPPALYKLLPP
ncbi:MULTISPECIES: hypothetical protein [Cohnella]|uniref:hypothetical protein n=1 Tax=Cohnella TaxID=329857 RepID=UPI0009B95D45|nr:MULTISPECIES: hypothetical protein [Cohnella]MBN2983037.1 hypothetical protein [Cohnella algarum]